SCRNGTALPIASNAPIRPEPTSTAYRMPHNDPPAMRPELNSVPAPTSDSSFAPVFRSTYARTRPPTKIGAVVAMGRYEPTAHDRADAERDRPVGVAGPAERDEQQAREDQRRDGHARDRIRRGADEARDARRDGDEEKTEDDDEDRREEVALRRHPRRDRQKD